MPGSYEHTTFKLRVPNPYRGFAVALLVLLGALVWANLPRVRALLVAYRGWTASDWSAAIHHPTIAFLGDASAGILVAASALIGLSLGVYALKLAALLYVPPRCPRTFSQPAVLQQALDRHSIVAVYDQTADASLRRLAKYVSPRFLLMTRPVKDVANSLLRALRHTLHWLVPVLVAFAYLRWGGIAILAIQSRLVSDSQLHSQIGSWSQQINSQGSGVSAVIWLGIVVVVLVLLGVCLKILKKLPFLLKCVFAEMVVFVLVCLLVPAWQMRTSVSPVVPSAARQFSVQNSYPIASRSQPAQFHDLSQTYQRQLADWVDELAAIPLPWQLAVTTLLSIGAMLATVTLLVPARQPRTDIFVQDQHLDGTGHPDAMFAEVKRIAEQSPTPGWVCTYHAQGKLKPGAIGDVASFAGQLLIEDQPVAIHGRPRLATYAAIAAGLLFVGFGLCRDPRSSLDHGGYGLCDAMLAQSLAVIFGVFLIGRVVALLSIFRFRSFVLSAVFSGEFSVAEINVGKSQEDSIESRNRAVRGDLRIRYQATALVSENQGLDGERYLVELLDEPAVRERMSDLMQRIEEHRVRGVSIARPNFRDIGSSEIVHANRLANAAKQLPLDNSARPEIPALPVSSPTKTCPFCAEQVLVAAKLCRFCGREFAAAS